MHSSVLASLLAFSHTFSIKVMALFWLLRMSFKVSGIVETSCCARLKFGWGAGFAYRSNRNASKYMGVLAQSSSAPSSAGFFVSLFGVTRGRVGLGVLGSLSSSSSSSSSSSPSCEKPGSSGMKGMAFLPIDGGAGKEAERLSTTNERMVTSLIVRRTSPVVLISTQYSLMSFSYLSCLAIWLDSVRSIGCYQTILNLQRSWNPASPMCGVSLSLTNSKL